MLMQKVLINLDRSTERLETFYRMNSHIKDIERFSAIDGRGIRQTLKEKGLLQESFGVDYTDGALGNAMSHKALWERAVASGEALTVIEDDAVFCKNFEEEVENNQEEEHENENTNPGGGESGSTEGGEEGTQPAPEEDEYDPNIGEQFQEGEILIEDANGNPVNNQTEENTQAAEETAAVQQNEQAAPAAEVVTTTTENTEVVEETKVQQGSTEAAPAATEPAAEAETTSIEFTEEQIAALVAEVYGQNTFEEGEVELEETSGKRR